MTERLKILVESRRLEATPATGSEIELLWEKGVRAVQSSRLSGMDEDSAFTLAYQGALQASAAVLLAAGYRAIGRDHHHTIFAGVAALDAQQLSRSARSVEEMRMDRHDVVYGSAGFMDAERLAEMHAAAEHFLAAAHEWLRQVRPELTLSAPDQPARPPETKSPPAS